MARSGGQVRLKPDPTCGLAPRARSPVPGPRCPVVSPIYRDVVTAGVAPLDALAGSRNGRTSVVHSW